MKKTIKFLHNSEIDIERWDSTVINAVNSRIYAESWYLDCVAPEWKGLIYGDYEYVMPIIQTRKYGINYIYQPRFAQQHGIFPPSTPAITDEIIACIKKEYRYFNISMNFLNSINKKNLLVEGRKNFLLSLNADYSELRKRYDSHAKRYTNYSKKHCVVSKHLTLSDFINLKEKYRQKGFSVDHLKILKLILSKSVTQQRVEILGAFSEHNELIASAIFLIEKRRFIYLNSVSSEEGKEARAMYAIVDNFIEQHAGRNMRLDFEGSNIEGIARFFIGFGAEPETYQHIKYNNLPLILRLIKN